MSSSKGLLRGPRRNTSAGESRRAGTARTGACVQPADGTGRGAVKRLEAGQFTLVLRRGGHQRAAQPRAVDYAGARRRSGPTTAWAMDWWRVRAEARLACACSMESPPARPSRQAGRRWNAPAPSPAPRPTPPARPQGLARGPRRTTGLQLPPRTRTHPP